MEKMQNDTVWLKPDLRDTQGFWFYWYFAVNRAKGKSIVFKLPNDMKKKKQLYDFLLRKGYSYDIIQEAFRQMQETMEGGEG